MLVCVFLRGAADALNIVVPHGESEYYRLRPTLAIPQPDDRSTRADLRAIDLDGFFGLHPALAPLVPAWQEQQLAFVHACGAPDESRSHFQAMELMERGVAAAAGPASGWLGRHLATLYADLRDYADQLLVVTMSEFGRRVQENGGLGTDHGHGGAMLLLGGGVAGGRVHGRWPGLAPEQLVGPGDLAITTDYRDILGEILQRRLNNPNLAEVFPGYTPVFREVVRADR